MRINEGLLELIAFLTSPQYTTTVTFSVLRLTQNPHRTYTYSDNSISRGFYFPKGGRIPTSTPQVPSLLYRFINVSTSLSPSPNTIRLYSYTHTRILTNTHTYTYWHIFDTHTHTLTHVYVTWSYTLQRPSSFITLVTLQLSLILHPSLFSDSTPFRRLVCFDLTLKDHFPLCLLRCFNLWMFRHGSDIGQRNTKGRK